MTKKRRRVFGAVAVLTALMLTYAGWKIYASRPLLQRLVVEKIETTLGGELQYRAFRPTFSGVDIQDVYFTRSLANRMRGTLHAQQISVRVNYVALLRNLLQPAPRVIRIAVLQPTLTLSPARTAKALSPATQAAQPTTVTPPAEAAKPGAPPAGENAASKYIIIENVEIENGEIVWQDSASGLPHVTIVNELSGWLHALGESHAQVRLHGKVRHPSEAELTLSTAVDLQHIALDSVQLDISDLQFTGKLPLAVPGRLEMAGGKLGGSLVLSRYTLPSSQKEIRVGGHLHLRDGKFRYAFDEQTNGANKTNRLPSWVDRIARKFFTHSGSNLFNRVASTLQHAPLQIESASFDATLQDGQLVIANGRQLVNKQPMHLNGRVQLGELPFWVALPERGQESYAVKIASNSLDGDSLDARAEIPAQAPAVDLHFVCDSLSLRDFFAPFHRVLAKKNLPTAKAHPPVSGIAAIRADFTGSFYAPRIHATLTSPHAVIYKKRVRQLEAQLSYGQPLADSSAAHSSETALHWRGHGMIDFDYPAAQNAMHAPELNWEGWGQIDLAAKNLPQSATVVVDGNLTPMLLRLLASRGFKLETHGQKESDAPFSFLSSLPETRLAGLAQISGSVWQPVVHGRMNLDVKRPHQTPMRWLGNFSLAEDTLHLRASLPNQTSRLNATVWRLGKRPLFKIEGLEVELLPAVFGEKISRSLLADLDMNFSLIGHTDSLNINIDARKKAAPTKLFHLVGYMLPLLQGDRVTSGYVKFFPDQPNAFAANYTLHVQDSLLKISDFRSEPWLNAALEVKTGGSREIKGGLRLAGADLARLITGAAHDSAAYRGKLFGELNLTGTLHDPQATGNFWLFDGFFHGLGNFALSAKMRADRSGWKVDSLALTKDKQPYLTAGLGYRRSDQWLHLNVRGADLRGGELLHALFDFPASKFDGVTTLDLQAEGPAKNFWTEKGVPLSGALTVRQARAMGVHFDELSADLAASDRSEMPATLSSRGLYLPRVRAVKQDAFSLTGDVFLPINRTSAVAASISGAGNFLAVLPEMSSWFKTTSSYGQLSLNLSGPYERLTIFNSHLKINDGAVTLARLAREVTHIEAEIFVDGRGTFVEIPRFTARFDDATVTLRNVERLPPLLLADAGSNAESTFMNTIDAAAWQPLRLGNSPLHLGTLLLRSDDNGLPLSIPGLMKKHETGRFRLTGLIDSTARRGDADEFIIAGPWPHPMVQGRVVLENVEFQFPFDQESDPALQDLLRRINWNVVAESRKDNHYVLTQTTAFNDVYVNLGIDDAASRLRFSGIVSDTTFSDEAFFIEGKVISTRGEVEYLDMNFEVEEFGAEFDKSQLYPLVYGRAKTVVRDSTNTPYNVYLTLVAVDPTSGREELRGRFQHAIFKLTSDQPNFWGTGQEQVLASLGYSVDNLGKSATEAVGIGTDNLLMRPFLRPVERAVQRTFGLDIVRFSSRFTRNFLTTNFNNHAADNAAAAPEAHRSLFRSSRVTVGKYLLNNLYLSYIGQLESGLERDSTNHVAGQPLPDSEYKLQLRHRLGLEYRLNPDMLLQVEYDFADESVRADRKIWLRHSFPVEFPKETN